jgi:hypothetical protein
MWNSFDWRINIDPDKYFIDQDNYDKNDKKSQPLPAKKVS